MRFQAIQHVSCLGVSYLEEHDGLLGSGIQISCPVMKTKADTHSPCFLSPLDTSWCLKMHRVRGLRDFSVFSKASLFGWRRSNPNFEWHVRLSEIWKTDCTDMSVMVISMFPCSPIREIVMFKSVIQSFVKCHALACDISQSCMSPTVSECMVATTEF